MTKKAQDLEGLDVKTDSKFMLWLKRIAYMTTILVTLSGGILGLLSYIREIRDPVAESGYAEQQRVLKDHEKDITENRKEIRFIYRTLIARTPNKTIKKRAGKLPKVYSRKFKSWKQLRKSAK